MRLRVDNSVSLLALSIVGALCHLAHSQQQNDPSHSIVTATDKDCPTLAELGYQHKRLTDISLNITVQGRRLPADCSSGLFSRQGDNDSVLEEWNGSTFFWAASELYHQPLYFENTTLERYGQSYHGLLQPWFSAAHFFGTFPIIPYKIGLDRTHDKVYTLGHYRPGSPTPPLGERLPLELNAAAFETGAWLGLIFILP